MIFCSKTMQGRRDFIRGVAACFFMAAIPVQVKKYFFEDLGDTVIVNGWIVPKDILK